MSEQSFPQTLVKGNETRTVNTPRDLVAAKFAGYVPQASKPAYDELQAQAEEAGVKPTQRREQLVDSLVRTDVETSPYPQAGPVPDQEPATAQPDELAEEPAPATPEAKPASPKPAKPSKA